MTQPAVLIVEDDANLREALIDTLQTGEHPVFAAASGQEALTIINRETAGDVEFHRLGRAAARVDLLHHLGQGCAASRGNQHPGAGPRQRQGEMAAQAAGGAGDQRGVPVKAEHPGDVVAHRVTPSTCMPLKIRLAMLQRWTSDGPS
jgi:CheY-like chemotaxis protein